MDPMRPCPNCHNLVADGVRMCPHCGAEMPAPEASWPPAPTNRAPLPTPAGYKLVTGSQAGDVILGAFLGILSFAIIGIGFAAAPIAYFAMRATYRTFARAIGIVAIIAYLVVLGAFIVCTVGLMRGEMH